MEISKIIQQFKASVSKQCSAINNNRNAYNAFPTMAKIIPRPHNQKRTGLQRNKRIHRKQPQKMGER